MNSQDGNMPTIIDMPKAQLLYTQLGEVQRVLDLLTAGATVTGFIVRSGDKETFAYVPIGTNTAQTLFTAQKTALTAQLRAMGYN